MSRASALRPWESAGRPWELPGVQAVLRAPRGPTELGIDWAAVVFATFAAPPALVLAGLFHPGGSAVLFWLLACGCFFTGLGLSLRLAPLPPRRVFPPARAGDEIQMLPLYTDPESPPELPGILPGMSRSEILEQLAKLRERGDLSGGEYGRAREALLGE